MNNQRDPVYGIVARQRLNAIFKELFRKSIHICSSFIPLFLKLAYWPVIILLLVALVVYSVSEILRSKGIEIPLISKVTEIAARKRDAAARRNDGACSGRDDRAGSDVDLSASADRGSGGHR